MGSHTGDSTPFVVENNIVNALEFLEQVSDAFLNWFKNNWLKNKVDKCHVSVSTKKHY